MEEKERYEYYPKQNQLYDKINDELYCLGIKQDKTRLVDFLNLMNEDWWTLYERNKELREENQQLKQQLAEKEKEIERIKTNYVGGMQNANEATRIFKEQYCKANQDKISFCIEQLEKLKEFCNNPKNRVEYEYCPNAWTYAVDKDKLMLEIDNQINELKGEEV